ncbi:MAG: YIP1 family protein [Dysgonamonadaceae bacterium]|jgi:hypothetical protein|nr:YIP1 family protein [Dysgonamonadaceae bacterium]
MYKRLFILFFNLISHPVQSWKEKAEEQDTNNENFYRSYLYPVVGTIALLSFIGIFFAGRAPNIEVKTIIEQALKAVLREALAYFAGFYVASCLLSLILSKYFACEPGKYVCERFTGYASAVVYAVAMVSALFPFLVFIRYLFMLFAAYTVWQGAIHYLRIKAEYLTKFTIFASILIVLSPLLIQRLLLVMMPGL